MSQIDARIPLMTQPVASPVEMMNNALALQGGVQRNALARMQLEALQARQPLEMEKLRYAIESARANAALRNALLLGDGASGGATPNVNALAGGGMNMTGRMTLPPRVQAALASDDPGIRAWGTAMAKQLEPRVVSKGGAIVGPGGVAYERPDIPEGTHVVDGVVQPRPGIPESVGAIKGAEARATAGFDLVDVPLMVNGKSVGTVKMTREQAANAAKGGGAFSIGPQAAPFPTMTIPPEVQRQRDADAARIREREGQPGGGGAIPSGVVLGTPPEAEQAAAKITAKGRAERELERPQATMALQNSVTNLQRLADEAQAIQSDPSLKQITGVRGKFPNMPGGSAANVQARLETLKSQIGFAVLQAMRDASKTGGALGQVSERELAYLQNNLAALDTSQGPEAFKRNLQQIVDYANGAIGRLKAAHSDTYSAESAPARPVSPGRSGGASGSWGEGWKIQRVD